jgi:hypothetical protein
LNGNLETFISELQRVSEGGKFSLTVNKRKDGKGYSFKKNAYKKDAAGVNVPAPAQQESTQPSDDLPF